LGSIIQLFDKMTSSTQLFGLSVPIALIALFVSVMVFILFNYVIFAKRSGGGRSIITLFISVIAFVGVVLYI
jgi:hypothetical protein